MCDYGQTSTLVIPRCSLSIDWSYSIKTALVKLSCFCHELMCCCELSCCNYFINTRLELLFIVESIRAMVLNLPHTI